MSTPTMDRATAAARRMPAVAVRFPQVVAALAVIGRITQGRGDPPGHRDGPLPRPRATWRTSASRWHRRRSPAPGAAPSFNFRPPPPAADRGLCGPRVESAAGALGPASQPTCSGVEAVIKVEQIEEMTSTQTGGSTGAVNPRGDQRACFALARHRPPDCPAPFSRVPGRRTTPRRAPRTPPHPLPPHPHHARSTPGSCDPAPQPLTTRRLPPAQRQTQATVAGAARRALTVTVARTTLRGDVGDGIGVTRAGAR